MLGSIIGDIIGSAYEFSNAKSYDFDPFPPDADFTDDTVLTCAVADAILSGSDYGRTIHDFARRYPGRGYGGMFQNWILSDNPKPYNSFGNGAAMRVSPVGFAFDSEEKVLAEAEKTAACSHNHPEGIRGAQSVALAVRMARSGSSKEEIRDRIRSQFGYNLDRKLADIRPGYHFDETCQGTVPEAIIAFLESTSFEDAIRKAIWLGGDSDTLACITGEIAEAYYGEIPAEWKEQALALLAPELKAILKRFNTTFGLVDL